jgi:hypothetical protein
LYLVPTRAGGRLLTIFPCTIITEGSIKGCQEKTLLLLTKREGFF